MVRQRDFLAGTTETLSFVKGRTIDATRSEIFAMMRDPPLYEKPLHDISAIEPMVDKVLAENPQSIADYKAGKEKAFAFLVGQVMKLCRGAASPAIVNELLTKKLK